MITRPEFRNFRPIFGVFGRKKNGNTPYNLASAKSTLTGGRPRKTSFLLNFFDAKKWLATGFGGVLKVDAKKRLRVIRVGAPFFFHQPFFSVFFLFFFLFFSVFFLFFFCFFSVFFLFFFCCSMLFFFCCLSGINGGYNRDQRPGATKKQPTGAIGDQQPGATTGSDGATTGSDGAPTGATEQPGAVPGSNGTTGSHN